MEFRKDTRGFRNNNPGNIRKGNDWKGEVDGGDNDFESFESVEFGIRAIYRLIYTYSKFYNIKTIESFITKYAPPEENHTKNYIKSVYGYMINNALNSPSAYLLKHEYKSNFHVHNLKPIFVGGIILVENGIQPFNFDFIKECENL